MKFCTACGSALEFFEFLDGELCSACLKKESVPPAPPKDQKKMDPCIDELSDATLSFEDAKLILKSPEGWILWSAPHNEHHQLKTIISRAQRILEIRKKRRKN